MTAMVPLLSPMRIGPVRVRNRILSSGHGTVLVQDGSVTDDLTPGLRRPRAGPLHHACADGHRRRLHPGCPELAEAVHRHGTTIFGHGSGLQVQQEPDHLLGHRLGPWLSGVERVWAKRMRKSQPSRPPSSRCFRCPSRPRSRGL